MRRIYLETPYAGDIEANLAFARACMRDCLKRGEAPFASHFLYIQTGILDDNIASERAWGIEAGLEWGIIAHATIVYTDRGITPGMQIGIDRALEQNRPVEYRKLADS